MSNREVRGPRSALTSFLQEKGIRARNLTYASNQGPNQASENSSAQENQPLDTERSEDSSETQIALETQPTSSSNSSPLASSSRAKPKLSKKRKIESSVDDEEEAAVEVTTPTGSAKASASKAKKKPKRKDEDDEAEDDELSRYIGDTPKNPTFNPYSVVAFCSRCRRRFARSSFVRVAKAIARGADSVEELCPACQTAGTKSTGQSITKKGKKKKSEDADDLGGEGRVPSLKAMCIKIVCENIDYVEEFGDIPQPVKIRIGQILSKQRTLNTENIRLFLTHTDDTVKLTDCTRVDETGLRQVGIYAPNLRVLELGFCGRMTDDALNLICQRCPFIEEMHLQGPFLVTDDGFSTIFQTFGQQLKRFSLEDSPKITTKSVLSIISACNPSSPVVGPSGKPSHDGLTILRFVRCSSLEDTALLALASHGCPLQQLDLVGLNEKSTTDNGMVAALEALGASLRSLDLSWNPKLGDATALAIRDRCLNIREVGLAGCEAITNKGLVEMLEGLNASMQDGEEARGLTKVDFARLPMGVVDDEVAGWIQKRCGAVLRLLNLNGAGAITRDALESLISSVPHLWSIDLSWVRCVDDEAIESLVETARELREVKVFGCNKVTDLAAKRKWKNDQGSVVKIVGCEFE